MAGGVLTIPLDKEHPNTYIVKSRELFVVQKDREGKSFRSPREYKFTKGVPETIENQADFERLQKMTWRKGKYTFPLFTTDIPTRSQSSGNVVAEQAMKIDRLEQMVNLIMTAAEKKGVDLTEAVAEVVAEEEALTSAEVDESSDEAL